MQTNDPISQMFDFKHRFLIPCLKVTYRVCHIYINTEGSNAFLDNAINYVKIIALRNW